MDEVLRILGDGFLTLRRSDGSAFSRAEYDQLLDAIGGWGVDQMAVSSNASLTEIYVEAS